MKLLKMSIETSFPNWFWYKKAPADFELNQ